METIVEFKPAGKDLEIKIKGGVAAETDLPLFPSGEFKSLIFSLEDVKYINSGGIRVWINWLNSARSKFPAVRMAFENLPYIVVRQAHSIREFFPKGSEALSFIVPYYCGKCGQNTDIKLKKSLHIDLSKGKDEVIRSISHTKCPQCGAEAEIDAVPEHYLSL